MSDKVEYSKLTPRMAEMQRKIEAASPNRTLPASSAYKDGWDRIFCKKKCAVGSVLDKKSPMKSSKVNG